MKTLLQRQLQQADYVRTVYAVTPEPGTELVSMLQPEFWSHVARQIKAGDVIEVRPAEGEWFARLYVRSVRDTEATVALLEEVKFSAIPAQSNEKIVKFRGRGKWSVLRASNMEVLAEGMDTREDAEAWAAAA